MDLSHNEISFIKVLEKANFEKLEELDLSFNYYMPDINILKNVNFKELKILKIPTNIDLYGCADSYKEKLELEISEYIKFSNLEQLYLSNDFYLFDYKYLYVIENYNIHIIL